VFLSYYLTHTFIILLFSAGASSGVLNRIGFANKYNADFFIPCVIDGVTFYFDIDTGAPAGLFFPSGLIKIKKRDEYRDIASDDRNVSLADNRNVSEYHLVKTSSIHLLDETYIDCFVMTTSLYSVRDDEMYHDFGMLGIDFLKYYDFLFDYRKLRKGKSTGMYYESNTPTEDRDYGMYGIIKKVPEFGVLNTTGFSKSGFIIHRILKDSIAYKVFGLRPGMILTRINGKPIVEISQEELFEPSYYLKVDNYTVLENNTERTIPSPLKSGLHEVPSAIWSK
jgi:hypothetical protein